MSCRLEAGRVTRDLRTLSKKVGRLGIKKVDRVHGPTHRNNLDFFDFLVFKFIQTTESNDKRGLHTTMAASLPAMRPLGCWKPVFRELAQQKPSRRSLTTVHSAPKERVSVPRGLPEHFYSQLPPSLRPDNGMLSSSFYALGSFIPRTACWIGTDSVNLQHRRKSQSTLHLDHPAPLRKTQSRSLPLLN